MWPSLPAGRPGLAAVAVARRRLDDVVAAGLAIAVVPALVLVTVSVWLPLVRPRYLLSRDPAAPVGGLRGTVPDALESLRPETTAAIRSGGWVACREWPVTGGQLALYARGGSC